MDVDARVDHDKVDVGVRGERLGRAVGLGGGGVEAVGGDGGARGGLGRVEERDDGEAGAAARGEEVGEVGVGGPGGLAVEERPTRARRRGGIMRVELRC